MVENRGINSDTHNQLSELSKLRREMEPEQYRTPKKNLIKKYTKRYNTPKKTNERNLSQLDGEQIEITTPTLNERFNKLIGETNNNTTKFDENIEKESEIKSDQIDLNTIISLQRYFTKKIDCFDGTERNFKEWLTNFEDLIVDFELDKKSKLQIIKHFIKGKAQDLIKIDKPIDYDQLTNNLLENCQEKLFHFDLHEELTKCKQEKEEGIVFYINHLKKINRKFDINNDNNLIDVILKGISNVEIKNKLLRKSIEEEKDLTIEEIIKLVKVEEECYNKLLKFVDNSPRTSNKNLKEIEKVVSDKISEHLSSFKHYKHNEHNNNYLNNKSGNEDIINQGYNKNIKNRDNYYNINRRSDKNRYCSYCKQNNHSEEYCWKKKTYHPYNPNNKTEYNRERNYRNYDKTSHSNNNVNNFDNTTNDHECPLNHQGV